MTVAWLALGLTLLTVGAELLVRGACRLAHAVGLPSLIIGLTVVAFGTSAPEFAVTVKAAWRDQADIALGNVVGSNTFNVLFILGVSALIAPLLASQRLVRLDVPIMIGVSAGVFALAMDGTIGRIEGALLLAGVIFYTAWLIRCGRRRPAVARATPAPTTATKSEAGADSPGKLGLVRSGVLVVAGLVLLVWGARLLVDAAVTLAQAWGASDLLIGLTLVAAGTSMPELATSIIASLRSQRDIAIGNVVGSNIFNLLGVLGASALIAPEGLAASASALRFDLPVMLAVAVACLPIFFTGGRISRGEGGVFVGFYVGYVLYLILAATHHEGLGVFSSVMLGFVIPMTVLGLGVSVAAALRRRGQLPTDDSQ